MERGGRGHVLPASRDLEAGRPAALRPYKSGPGAARLQSLTRALPLHDDDSLITSTLAI